MDFDERFTYPSNCGPKLIHDGGLCCGIKHIYELGYSPANNCLALKAVEQTPETRYCDCGGCDEPCELDDEDERYFEDPLTGKACVANTTPEYCNPTHSLDRFFTLSAPKETYGERVERYLDFLRRERPRCLVVVSIVRNQQPGWPEWLEERGFKVVTKFRNSNSGATVEVFHLVIGE